MDEHDDQSASGGQYEEDARWWRCRGVLGAIGFRMMVIWMISSAVMFVMTIAYGALVEKLGGSSLVNWAEASLLGCCLAGMGAGLVFGVPLGVVSVLGQRERALELEQELEFQEAGGKAASAHPGEPRA